MIEILFRAKRKNWRELPKEEWWVEGSYHHQTDYYGESCDKHYIIDGTETDMEGYGEHYEIDPETLCLPGARKRNGGFDYRMGEVIAFFAGAMVGMIAMAVVSINRKTESEDDEQERYIRNLIREQEKETED